MGAFAVEDSHRRHWEQLMGLSAHIEVELHIAAAVVVVSVVVVVVVAVVVAVFFVGAFSTFLSHLRYNLEHF